jgi:hypothetical protein
MNGTIQQLLRPKACLLNLFKPAGAAHLERPACPDG